MDCGWVLPLRRCAGRPASWCIRAAAVHRLGFQRNGSPLPARHGAISESLLDGLAGLLLWDGDGKIAGVALRQFIVRQGLVSHKRSKPCNSVLLCDFLRKSSRDGAIQRERGLGHNLDEFIEKFLRAFEARILGKVLIDDRL